MMHIPADFHFLRPYWFLALVPCLIAVFLLWKKRGGLDALSRFCDPLLLSHLVLDGGSAVSRWRIWLLAASWFIAIMALAGPVWEKQPQPVFRIKSGRVIVLDMSPSMAASDLKPSRLERAVFKIKDMLNASKEGYTGLVVFGAEPFTVVPLTDDTATIEAMLPALSEDIMPVPGDNGAPALRMAEGLLLQAGIKDGEVILVSDGISDMASAMSETRRLRARGFTVSVLGTGTEKGAPVPLEQGGFARDGRGKVIISRLDREGLEKIASAGGGTYCTITPDDSDISRIMPERQEKVFSHATQVRKGHNVSLWKEEGAWLVLLLLPLCLGAFRRGWFLVICVSFHLLVPGHALAFGWKDLWQREDQQAWELYEKGDYDRAARLFRTPERRAAALYKAGKYKEAAELFERQNTADAFYNRGNSLARAGRLEDAIRAYDKALKLDPNDSDARYNRDLVKKILEEQRRDAQKEKNQAGKDGQGRRKDGKKGKNSGQNGENGKDGKKQQESGQERSRGNGANASKAEGQHHKDREHAGQKRDVKGQDKSDNGEKGESGNSGEERALKVRQGNKRDDNETKDGGEGREVGAGQVGRQDEKVRKSEKEMALEQWLRQIPDDPSGLLRRKFYLEHRMRSQGK